MAKIIKTRKFLKGMKVKVSARALKWAEREFSTKTTETGEATGNQGKNLVEVKHDDGKFIDWDPRSLTILSD